MLVTTLGPISGAHFNPAVTLAFGLRGDIPAGLGTLYIVAQVAGCVLGVWLAHAMFEQPILQLAATMRDGRPQILAEAVATFALVFAIFATLHVRPSAVPSAVALTIAAGYWWTASTSFANPAITLARAFSDTFAGIRLEDVPGFVLGQGLGAVLAFGVYRLLYPDQKPEVS